MERLLADVQEQQPFNASTDVGVLLQVLRHSKLPGEASGFTAIQPPNTNEPLQALDAGAGRLGRFAERFFRRMAPSPTDYARLRGSHRRLAAVRAAVEGVLPESPSARDARRRREAARERILDSPVQYRLKRGGAAGRPEPDWASAREVGDFLDDLPAALAAAEAAAAAWEARLVAGLGAAVGGRLHASLRDWCRRKREAWAACAGLLTRQRQLSQDLARLHAQGGPATPGGASGASGAASGGAGRIRPGAFSPFSPGSEAAAVPPMDPEAREALARDAENSFAQVRPRRAFARPAA